MSVPILARPDNANTELGPMVTVPMDQGGWWVISRVGEIHDERTGLTVVIDEAGATAMALDFQAQYGPEPAAGVLIEFDRPALDGAALAAAAGWVLGVGWRPIEPVGLTAYVQWSDVGNEAVNGYRYRYLTPVWMREDCEELGNGRIRPVRFRRAAVTNDAGLEMRLLGWKGRVTR